MVHEIDTGSTRPIRCNPRKLSPKKIKIQQELVDKMLEEGQIEHSVSAWSAPTVLVTKKDGTTRFCVDYKKRDRITACHKCIARKSPVNRHQPMGHVPVSGRFERVAMDLLDVSVISAKGHKYILVVCDYFTKYTEAYPLTDKTARSVADALMDFWLPRYGFPMFFTFRSGKRIRQRYDT